MPVLVMVPGVAPRLMLPVIVPALLTLVRPWLVVMAVPFAPSIVPTEPPSFTVMMLFGVIGLLVEVPPPDSKIPAAPTPPPE
jgi:hypothetical protein